jgi:hypothetical protein
MCYGMHAPVVAWSVSTYPIAHLALRSRPCQGLKPGEDRPVKVTDQKAFVCEPSTPPRCPRKTCASLQLGRMSGQPSRWPRERAWSGGRRWPWGGGGGAVEAVWPTSNLQPPGPRHLRGGDFATLPPPGTTGAVLKPHSTGERKAPSTATRSAPGGR